MAPPSTQPEPKKNPPARKTARGDRPPPEPALRCPRCDSANTKFCYYNNYSLAQPRHFCKTCRRYWTRGGALRNVPIGGGCRKTKKPKSSFSPLTGDSAGLRFFQTVSPAMDFQLGGLDFPKITPDAGLPGPFPSLGILSNTCGAVASTPCFSAGFQEISSLNYQNSLITSSIESLSSINQDLHWKLQRQRMAALFLGDDGNQKEALVQQKNQPVFFQDMEAPKKTGFPGGPIDKSYVGGSGLNNICNTGLSTELFFDNSYGTVAPAPATNAGNLNEGAGNWSNGIQGLV